MGRHAMKAKLALSFTTLIGSSLALGQSLSLDDYLNQVQQKNEGFKSADEGRDAAALQVGETHLLVEPSLFASVQHVDDEKPSILYSIGESVIDVYSVGFSETTTVGLTGKLHYDMTNTRYTAFGFPGSPLSNVYFSQGSPVLDMTMSLWRNFWGAETKGQLDAGVAAQDAKLHNQAFAQKNILVQAESAYWSLSLARESVKVAFDALERAKISADWNLKKSKIGLADEAEFLQAQAALEARQVDLQNAKNDLIEAARNFNNQRGQNDSAVPEGLASLNPADIRKTPVPNRVDDREDVKAALANARLARANAELARQKYLPTLELFGTLAANNPNPTNTSTAIPDSFSSTVPTKSIGIRLNAPLDWGVVGDVKKGYMKDQLAADLDVEKKRFDQETNWHDLQDRYQQHLDMLTLYERLEKIQLSKLERERIRRSQGRTTTQQVLNFEVDYEQAQLSRLRAMSELLQIIAQMKLYGGV